MMGRAAFLAPLIVTSPWRLSPPFTMILSITPRPLGAFLLRRPGDPLLAAVILAKRDLPVSARSAWRSFSISGAWP